VTDPPPPPGVSVVDGLDVDTQIANLRFDIARLVGLSSICANYYATTITRFPVLL